MIRVLRDILPLEVRIELRRFGRWLYNIMQYPKPSQKKISELDLYPFLLVSHSSKLVRKINPELMHLQYNKIHNLQIACSSLDGLLLEPGDIFSFCSIVSRTSKKRGYIEGLEMRDGKLVGAPGGGLCQLANLIYWMALNLNLQIIERHHHSLDLFPDDNRKVPFGMGATVFYNYLDLRFRNTLNQSLVLKVWVEPPYLHGAFYSDKEKSFDVKIVETFHRYYRDKNGVIWRENRVVRYTTFRDKNVVREEEIAHNKAKVCYPVPDSLIDDENHISQE